MKMSTNIRTRIFLIGLLSFLCFDFCAAQVSKKTYQTIIAGNAESVRVNIEGAEVQLKETKGTRILVETLIQLSVPNEALLDFVVESGRYELTQTMDQSTRELAIESKKDKNVIVVKGEQCEEHITYVVYIPTTMRSVKQ
jgi:ethanolamine utilization protein EutA (predicted chaperonin)